jgi:hypothetical protein
MTAQDVLENVARGMVAAGLYKDVTTAIRALALEQIERKIAHYRDRVQDFEKQHGHSLEDYSGVLKGKASIADEEEWMEWKGAVVMLEAWQKALQEVLKRAS